jgi:formylglycine-generating enzyme required for sulfatase activity
MPSTTDPQQSTRALNCVTQGLAEALCESVGGQLPSEAQWEWAGGSREHRWLYPWGDNDPPCGAIVEVGPERPPCTVADCDPLSGFRVYPDPVGTHPFDSTIDGALDMSGNLREWIYDAFEPYTGECWRQGSYRRVDPVCDPNSTSTDVIGIPYRGGAYNPTGPYPYRVPMRALAASDYPWVELGFRCARTTP